jgi:tRNA pseudouridine55 synthase
MNGILNILKPPGMTSHDVVSRIRKITGIKKVGHTGTLDPGAAGVLPVCIGKATKVVDYIMSGTKTYICELTLGNITDTLDKYGKFLNENNSDFSHVNIDLLNKVLEKFKGQISQTPPAFSAIKINGKRSYEMAREGQEVILPSRTVIIYKIEILNFALPTVMLKIECSKGTYIRSICHDIGTELGCGAYMSFLLRTKTGSFTLNNSVILDELTKENVKNYIINSDLALDFKSIYIEDKYTKSLMNGNSIKIENHDEFNSNELVKVYILPDEFIAIGSIDDDILKINKLLI